MTAKADSNVPLARERLHVDKRVVETGRVTVRTRVAEEQTWVREELAREDVQVERIDIGREVDEVPQVRTEGDTLVIPIYEEIVVVEKRLVLQQEIRLTRRTETRIVEQPVTVRRLEPEVVRQDVPGTSTPDPEDYR